MTLVAKPGSENIHHILVATSCCRFCICRARSRPTEWFTLFML